MSASPTTTAFDLAGFRRAMERMDLSALPDYVHADVHVEEIDERTRPAAPHVIDGLDALRSYLEQVAGLDLTVLVEDAVAGEDRVALQTRCRYPDGNEVVAMSMLRLRAGKVAHWREVQAFDV